MANRSLLRGYPLLIILCVGMGGIAPDIGHFLNIVTKGQVDWCFGHSLSFWLWWTGASLVGLLAKCVLTDKT